jgi:hypothetical protein
MAKLPCCPFPPPHPRPAPPRPRSFNPPNPVHPRGLADKSVHDCRSFRRYSLLQSPVRRIFRFYLALISARRGGRGGGSHHGVRVVVLNRNIPVGGCSHCTSDYIAVYSGPTTSSPLLKMLCGKEKTALTYDGQKLLVEFRLGNNLFASFRRGRPVSGICGLLEYSLLVHSH